MNTKRLIVKNGQARALGVLGTEVRFLCDGEETGGSWSLMEIVVPQGSGPPPHAHDWDEACYITSGEIEFTLGAQRILAAAGDFLYAPAGTLHAFRGVSEHDARMLVIDVPAHAARFFREVDREVTELPRELPKVLEIGARNGIRFALPT